MNTLDINVKGLSRKELEELEEKVIDHMHDLDLIDTWSNTTYEVKDKLRENLKIIREELKK